MKITHIKAENYRSLKCLEIDVDDYTALIGANGTGKSCILYALDWFFNGYKLSPSDISGYTEDHESEPTDTTVAVTVTFGSLTEQDKDRLKQYGRGSVVRFRRSWTLGEDKDKVVGNASQGPGFAELRSMSRVGEFRPAYAALRQQYNDLPDLGTSPNKESVHAALAEWESDANNAQHLVTVSDDDANHMFGINGPNVIKDCVRLVLIPAAADIANQIGSSGKGSALNELIGSLMSNASAAARSAWLLEHSDKIEELNRLIREGVETSTGMQAGRINSRLAGLVPNASITFTPTIPEWAPRNDASVSTDVTIDGLTNDVSRQGHGVQRAVMIAMFQSLVPDAALTTVSHEQAEDETPEQAALRLELEIANLPVLIVCIEEPEIYQHPIRARSFARILTELSGQPSAQVVVATHSPYFVRPAQFSSLRRFRLESGESKVMSTDSGKVATSSVTNEQQVQKIVQKRLPSAFSEGFFSDKVAIVEGDTDKAVLEALAEKLDIPLDTNGISVVDLSSKEGLRIPYSIFNELGVPVYVVVDGDGLGAARKHPEDETKRNEARASHKRATEKILEWLPSSTAQFGNLPYAFGDPTIVSKQYTIWEDDIEEELNKWPSFVDALNSNNSKLRSKDLLAYRTAVLEANIDDLPLSLKSCIETISSFS